MSFTWIDSVGHYTANPYKYTPRGSGTPPTVQAGYGRAGGRAHVWTSAGAGLYVDPNKQHGMVHPEDGYMVGAYVQYDLTGSSLTRIQVFRYGGVSLYITNTGTIQIWKDPWNLLIAQSAPGVVPPNTVTMVEWGQGLIYPLSRVGHIVMVNETQVLGRVITNFSLLGDENSPTFGPDVQPAETLPLLAIGERYARTSGTFYTTEYPYAFQGNFRCMYYPVNARTTADPTIWRDPSETQDFVPVINDTVDPGTDYIKATGDFVTELNWADFYPQRIPNSETVDPSMAQLILAGRGEPDPSGLVPPVSVGAKTDYYHGISSGYSSPDERYYTPASGDGLPQFNTFIYPAAALLGGAGPTPSNPTRNFYNDIGWWDGTQYVYAIIAAGLIDSPVMPPNDARVHQLGLELFFPGNPGPYGYGGFRSRAGIIGA